MNVHSVVIVTKPKQSEVARVAGELFMHTPDWPTFYRDVLGPSGAAGKLFPLAADYRAFTLTSEYAEVQRLLERLRAMQPNDRTREPLQVITVRLPKALHEGLKAEAHDHNTSLNQLCVSKLLQALAEAQ